MTATLAMAAATTAIMAIKRETDNVEQTTWNKQRGANNVEQPNLNHDSPQNRDREADSVKQTL